MPLTIDEQEKVHAAQIEKLIYDIMAAIDDGNTSAFTNARIQLLDLSINIEVPIALRYRAKEAHDTAALDMTLAGLAQMTAIADAISTAGSGLRSAIRAAETGKEELFFPSLAAAASKAVATFEKFKDAAESLQAKLEAAGKGDLKNRLETLVAAAKEVKSALS